MINSPLVKQNTEIVCGWRFPSIKDALILNIPKINRKYEKNKLNYILLTFPFIFHILVFIKKIIQV